MARFDFARGIGDGAFSIAKLLSRTRCQDRFLADLATLVVSAGAKILGRAHASGIALPQFPHQQPAEIHLAFLACSLQAHRIPNKRLPDKALSPCPFDLAIAPDPSDKPRPGIAQGPTLQLPGLG